MYDPVTIPIGMKFQAYGGIGATKQRQLIAAGELETVCAGGRRLIIVQSWLNYVERQKAKPEPDMRRGKTGDIPPKGGRRQVSAETSIS